MKNVYPFDLHWDCANVGCVLVIAQMFSNTHISQQFLFIIETQDQSG